MVTTVVFAAMVLGNSSLGLEPASTAEVFDCLNRSLSRIQSFHVKYVIHYEANAEWPPGMLLRREVASLRPGFFFHATAHGHDRLRWQDDIRCQRCFVTANEWYLEFLNHRTYRKGSLNATDPLPGSLNDEVFLWATGLWILDGRPAPRRNGKPVMLSDLVNSPNDYVLHPDRARILGRPCIFLEAKGRDRLWLDTEREFALVAREWIDEDTEAVAERWELSAFEQSPIGIWFPRRIRSVQFDSAATQPKQRTRKVRDFTLEIESVSVNTASVSDFVVKPVPGAVWLNPPEKVFLQTEPGGREFVQEVADWAKRNVAEVTTHTTSSGSRIWRWSAGAAIFLLCFGIVILLDRWQGFWLRSE